MIIIMTRTGTRCTKNSVPVLVVCKGYVLKKQCQPLQLTQNEITPEIGH